MRKWFDRVSFRLGALPARRVSWTLVALFSLWVVLDVMVFRVTTGLAKPSYDAMVRARLWVAPADPRILIIDIDEASLSRMGKEFGRWPWPRDTLATVLDYIEKQGPAAIVWDILFSDADRLSPGGDAAFNQSVLRSLHSHFPVVRLPKSNDPTSQITRAALAGLWAPVAAAPAPAASAPASTVALIPPALPAIEASRLGYNNGYVDSDGVLRRYRYIEPLADGSAIQSIASSVLRATHPGAYAAQLQHVKDRPGGPDGLIAWRARADAYPHVPFADVFALADGGKPSMAVPNFAGKVVIIGSTAPSLHDIHPTPLSSMGAGVDSLATAIDNALNQRVLNELPRWLQALLAIAMCVALGLWVQFKSVASLAPALLLLPAALLAVSYGSLNGPSLFLDLHLAAALALVFLAVLGAWGNLRRNYWCSPPAASLEPVAIWAWQRRQPWLDEALDRLIDAVERHAPTCRVVVCDTTVSWPSALRWPELARFAAVVGPQAALNSARERLEPALQRLAYRSSGPVVLPNHPNREKLAISVFEAWANLHKSDTNERLK